MIVVQQPHQTPLSNTLRVAVCKQFHVIAYSNVVNVVGQQLSPLQTPPPARQPARNGNAAVRDVPDDAAVSTLRVLGVTATSLMA
jgi:hypothetical protein